MQEIFLELGYQCETILTYDHAYALQAEQELKPQLDEVRKEAAAALMQASLAQRALSKAEEAWETQRSAANKELQLASKHMAELQQQIDSAQRAQVRAAF